AGVRIQVREVQADRRRLEHVAIVELHDGHASERLALPVRLPAPLLPGHDGQLVRLADLLKHPQNPPGAPRMLSMKNAQHRADHILLAASLVALAARRTRVTYAPAMPDLRERWRTSFIEATTYDWAVEHEHVAGVLGRLIWGTDTAAFYRDIARLSELPAGTSVLDIPCGGGVAFRGVRPEQE